MLSIKSEKLTPSVEFISRTRYLTPFHKGSDTHWEKPKHIHALRLQKNQGKYFSIKIFYIILQRCS